MRIKGTAKQGGIPALITAVFTVFIILAVSSAAQGEVTKEQAKSALSRAEEDITEMSEAGFSVERVNTTYQEARVAYYGENYTKLLKETESINDTKKREEAKELIIAAKEAMKGQETDYATVIQKTKEIEEIKERAFEVNDLITALEMRSGELEGTINVTIVRQLLEEARAKFRQEAYDEAEELANKGFDELDKRAAEATQLKLMYKQGRESLTSFVKNNWLWIIIVAAAAFIVGFATYRITRRELLKRRLKNLKLERDILNDLIKKAQVDRFQKGQITKKEFEIKVQRFKERLVEVNKEIPIVMGKLKGDKQES